MNKTVKSILLFVPLIGAYLLMVNFENTFIMSTKDGEPNLALAFSLMLVHLFGYLILIFAMIL